MSRMNWDCANDISRALFMANISGIKCPYSRTVSVQALLFPINTFIPFSSMPSPNQVAVLRTVALMKQNEDQVANPP